MVVEFGISDLGKMSALARDLRAAGEEGRGLRRALLAASRLATKPMIEAAKESARENLPKRGGLNEYIASSKFSVRNSLGKRAVGSRIVAQKPGGAKGSHDLQAFDDGSFRHPVFGRWLKNQKAQQIDPGWFTKPMQKAGPAALAEFRLSMNMIARRLERGNF